MENKENKVYFSWEEWKKRGVSQKNLDSSFHTARRSIFNFADSYGSSLYTIPARVELKRHLSHKVVRGFNMVSRMFLTQLFESECSFFIIYIFNKQPRKTNIVEYLALKNKLSDEVLKKSEILVI